jgi:uncharacterized protein (TIGR02996 family)
MNQGAQAQESILEAIRSDPYNLPAYSALVEVLRQTGDFEAGRSVLLRALAREPASGFIRLAYADLLFFHGDRDRAVAECSEVLRRDPGNQDALGRLVSLYDGEGEKEKAFRLMLEARSSQPMNYENNLGLAKVYEARGDEDRAVDCLRAATLSGPATAQAHIFIARHLGKLKRHEEELVELARARRVALLLGDAALADQVSETIRAVSSDLQPPGKAAKDERN